jgi:dihydroorotate dehydrogenase subfamily 2
MKNCAIATRNAVIGALYRNILKPVLFLIDAEKIHESFIRIGSILGATGFGRACTRALFGYKDRTLEQDILNIHFNNPIGLAAGFDYEGRLTNIMGSVGMGFSTVGTITNLPYGGNPKPRLSRLVKSKSLLVNKGFKNMGISATLKYLRATMNRSNGTKINGGKFLLPIGMSIGKTNTLDITTQEQAIDDICSAFKEVEHAGLPFSYYELNISCPNLQGNVEFYRPEHLEQLLKSVFAVRLSKPVFIKMPIVKTNEETLAMLEVIAKSPAAGIVIGNLQDDPRGKLSGMPTQKRSDELIRLAYEKYGGKSIASTGRNNSRRLVIIGCGGVFSAEDAYRKIRLGASLVQMITGMIFEGPQAISEINRGISRFLARDGFAYVSQAIGADNVLK